MSSYERLRTVVFRRRLFLDDDLGFGDDLCFDDLVLFFFAACFLADTGQDCQGRHLIDRRGEPWDMLVSPVREKLGRALQLGMADGLSQDSHDFDVGAMPLLQGQQVLHVPKLIDRTAVSLADDLVDRAETSVDAGAAGGGPPHHSPPL